MLVHLNKAIKDKYIQKIIREIVASPDKAVTVLIDSTGGDLESAEFLHGFLASSEKEITTVVVGNCCSAAVLVSIAGDERWAIPTAKFMIHEPHDLTLPDGILNLHCDDDDDESEIPILAKDYDDIIKAAQDAKSELQDKVYKYYKLISDHSNLSVYRIKKLVTAAPKGDWYFTAKEAVRYGIVENIGSPGPVTTPEP